MPVAASIRGDGDSLCGKFVALVGLGPVSIVAEKMSLKIGFEQSIKAVDIVAVTGDLEDKRDAAFGREDQMLADAVKPTLQRGAVPFSGESSQPFLFACPDGPADIDGMGIDDGKGGLASPSISRKAPERR